MSNNEKQTMIGIIMILGHHKKESNPDKIKAYLDIYRTSYKINVPAPIADDIEQKYSELNLQFPNKGVDILALIQKESTVNASSSSLPSTAEGTKGGGVAADLSVLSAAEITAALHNMTGVFPPVGSNLFNSLLDLLNQQRNNFSSSAPVATPSSNNKYVIVMDGKNVVIKTQDGTQVGDKIENCNHVNRALNMTNCSEVLLTCASGDIDKCLELLSNDPPKDDVMDANPKLARDFLNSISYPMVYTREGNKTTRKYGSFNDYLTKLKEKNANIATKAEKATNIKNVLERIANMINTKYPQIINELDLYDSSRQNPTDVKANVLLKYPLHMGNVPPGNMTKLILPTLQQRSNSFFNSFQNIYPHGNITFPMGMGIGTGMYGGNQLEMSSDIVKLSKNMVNFYKKGIEDLIGALNNKGQTIDAYSNEGIQKRLADFEAASVDAAENIKTLQNYIQTTARVSDQEMKPTLEYMKKYSETYKDIQSRYVKSEDSVVNVIIKLQNLLANVVSNGNDSNKKIF